MRKLSRKRSRTFQCSPCSLALKSYHLYVKSALREQYVRIAASIFSLLVGNCQSSACLTRPYKAPNPAKEFGASISRAGLASEVKEEAKTVGCGCKISCSKSRGFRCWEVAQASRRLRHTQLWAVSTVAEMQKLKGIVL